MEGDVTNVSSLPHIKPSSNTAYVTDDVLCPAVHAKRVQITSAAAGGADSFESLKSLGRPSCRSGKNRIHRLYARTSRIVVAIRVKS